MLFVMWPYAYSPECHECHFTPPCWEQVIWMITTVLRSHLKFQNFKCNSHEIFSILRMTVLYLYQKHQWHTTTFYRKHCLTIKTIKGIEELHSLLIVTIYINYLGMIAYVQWTILPSWKRINASVVFNTTDLQYIPRNMHTVLLCFALLWLCNRS